MKQVLHFLQSLLSQLKDPLIVFFTTLGLFLAPIAELIFAAILFSFLDFITALAAAHKKNVPITSEKMGNTFPKIILYSLTIIFVHYLDEFLVHKVKIGFLDHLLRLFIGEERIASLNHIKLTAAVAFLILLREMKSIDENWQSFFGWSFWKTITEYIISPILKLKKLIQKNDTK